ncbi:estradiol 17-beta-dehydrogenase 11-like isoform X2 [Hemicordylus capensis]|uniref:estradiol 17-beta-dehydrogenase 11-like isoform X2 n=1 Tax=Hemicordylus capensis TaxID=884348 RepID=UPI0023047634|nr:estradiol 17-beta-dehydrogenase 11-like isoform X2 [Hemicordylus capensis]
MGGRKMNLLLDLLWLLVLIIYYYVEALVKLFIPVKRKSVSGEIVLITGAGHGIGRLTAYEFAKRHSKLVLWDINKVKKDIGDVSILVNNAGVVATADLLSTQDKQIQKIFEVNILAHHWTTKAFLPAMMENNHGHIVTVASAGGHMTVPFLVSYCSSKFAAVGFHKGLTQELSALGKDGIQTTCLCPFFINTGFIKCPRSRLMPVLEPQKVADKLIDGILCNQKMIFVPPLVKGRLLLERILPEHAIVAFDQITKVKFDAVVGSKGKQH